VTARRRRLARLERDCAAARLEGMTIEELIDELVELELSFEEPVLTVLLLAAGSPRGMALEEHRVELDRAFCARDQEALRQLIAHVFRDGNWSAVCSAIEATMGAMKGD